MAVVVLDKMDVLARCRHALGLNAVQNGPLDSEFLASALRHAAGFLCPCSAATLRAVLIESLQFVYSNEDLPSLLDSAIEGLLVGGDLLELNQVTTDDPDVRGTWVFAAPPSYIVRPNGSIFLTGIVPDRDTFLPLDLMGRIKYDGFTRAIMPAQDEQLAEELTELGLQRLSADNWLKAPKVESAGQHADRLTAKLSAAPPSGEIPDLQIIDPSKPNTYYRGRWVKPKSQTGMFVGRRPQEFGSPVWCFLRLEDGEPQQIFDLPLPKSRLRGCDAAWHLQMAIDHANASPQCYTVREAEQYVFVEFFSPLPLWAERRLMLFGRHSDSANCLFSYRLTRAQWPAEEKFLQERLWLSPVPTKTTSPGER